MRVEVGQRPVATLPRFGCCNRLTFSLQRLTTTEILSDKPVKGDASNLFFAW